MKTLLLIFLTTLSFHHIFAQQSSSFKQEAALIMATFKKNHYCPKTIDNAFSEKVFNKVISELDSRRTLFTQNDIKNLSIYKYTIDEDLCGKSWNFLPALTNLYRQRLENSEKIFTAILDKPISFKENEFISFSNKDTLFAKDEAELVNRWKLRLKYNILANLSHYVDSTQKTFPEWVALYEASTRAKIKTIKKRYINRIVNNPEGFENYVASEFFAAIALEFDPHSMYFSKTQWQNFESSLAKDGYSFGFEVQESEQGELEISLLIPGGPAWRSNELHDGDILINLKWEGKATIDLLGADVNELREIIQTSNKDKMHLTVRTATGQIKTVSLLKEKVRDEDNVVRSYVLNGDRKIGYISLPGFYSEGENAGTKNGCSNDVAKEIVKLQKENIEGLILDIRYNGGGSLQEGSDMAGIFINEGPLFMIKSKDEKPTVVKDFNRGTVYDGPLLVMVNGQSASASELLTSTLQDYNRAIILGSSTYGKATAQIVMPLDSNLNAGSPENEILKSPYGLVSVTMRKLYRVTGKTAQLNGVKPDIILPDIFDLYDYKESTYKNALESDSINKKAFFTSLAPLPKNGLNEKSQARIASKDGFIKIKQLTQNKTQFENYYNNIPLTLDGFKNHTSKQNQWWDSYTDAKESNSSLYKTNITTYDQEFVELDPFNKDINQTIIKNINEDIYIEEAYSVLTDLIHITNK